MSALFHSYLCGRIAAEWLIDMDGQHPNKQDPRPKRRKDKDNPYDIFTVGIGTNFPHYYIRFADGVSAEHCLEINQELFLALNQFELDDLSHLNEVDNHYEHISLSDAELDTRAAYQRETVEETAFRHIENEALHAALKQLPKKQYRRLVLYYFGGFTYEQIAEMEGCSHPAIIKSIKAAIRISSLSIVLEKRKIWRTSIKRSAVLSGIVTMRSF